MRRAIALALVVAGAACGRDNQPQGALSWRLEPDFTVGSLEGPDAFGSVQAVLADGRGRLYVADGQAAVISIWDSLGRRVEAMGRFGSGPGEIGALQSMAWLGDDTLAVMDPGNARIGLFGPDGAWLGQFSHQPIGGSALDVRFFRLPHAAWALQLDRGTVPPVRHYVRFTAAGPDDTVPNPLRGLVPSPGVTCERPDGGLTFFRAPFGAQHLFTFTPQGTLLQVWTAGYRVVETAPAGDTMRILERDLPSVPVDDAEWEDAVGSWHAFHERWPDARCDGDLTRPAVKPAIRFLMHDAEGRLWVERPTASGFAWDVWEGDALAGSLASPDRDARVEPYVRDGHLYVTTRDSLGIQRVAVYRLSPT